MKHKLKILPKYFKEVINNRKQFEIRKNDRDFKVGDTLLLKEWEGVYLGSECIVSIDFLLKDTDFEGIAPGFCVMSISNTKILSNINDLQNRF